MKLPVIVVCCLVTFFGRGLTTFYKGCNYSWLYEVPTWYSQDTSPRAAKSGLKAKCPADVTIDKETGEATALRVLILTQSDTMTVKKASFNSANNHLLHDLVWRLAKMRKIVFESGAFEGIDVNLYIYDVSELVIESGAFVKCRGSISLFNVSSASVDKDAAVDSNIIFIRLGLSANTRLSLSSPEGETTKNFTDNNSVLVFSGYGTGRTPHGLRIATFAVEVIVLVVCVLVLCVTLAVFMAMSKLYRQNYESAAQEIASGRQVHRRVPNLPLPPRPPQEIPLAAPASRTRQY